MLEKYWSLCVRSLQDPTAEDTMLVQIILASRMGTRELEDSEVSQLFTIFSYPLLWIEGEGGMIQYSDPRPS